MVLNLTRKIFLSLFLAATFSQAATIDKTLTVQVYQLCDNSGANCASLGPSGNEYFEDAVNKIWAQAGISIGFNFVSSINSTAFSYLDDSVTGDGFVALATSYGTFGPSSSTVDMFLVHTIVGAYGEGWVGAGGLAIAMDTVMSYNGGLGRLDTIAHEIGHNLGLDHTTPGNNYLMTTGGSRTTPTTLGDITPDGLGLDLLSPAMISTVRQSSLLSSVPEPSTYALFAAGLFVTGLLRRRKV